MTKTRFAKMLASRQAQQQQTSLLLQELAARAHASKVLRIAAEHKISTADAAAFVRDMEQEN